MGNTMVPKNIRVERYDVWAFKCRVARMIWIFDVFARSFEVLSFLRHFQAKIHIFVCIMKLNKIIDVSRFVSSDLGMLFRWLKRH